MQDVSVDETLLKVRLLLAIMLAACGGSTPSVVEPVAVGQPDEGERIRLKLERGAHVGQRFRVHVRSEGSHLDRMMDGPRVHHEDQWEARLELVGVARVEAISDVGGAATVRYRIERFERADESGRHEMLPPGTDVVVAMGREPVVTINGARADREMRRALSLVLDFGADEDQDVLFGADEPQLVGATWPLRTGPVTEALGRAGYPTTPEHVRGSATFIERVSDPVDGYRVRASLHVDHFEVENGETHEAELRAISDAVFPLDPDEPWVRSRISTTVYIDATLRGAGSISMRFVGERRSDVVTLREQLPDGAEP